MFRMLYHDYNVGIVKNNRGMFFGGLLLLTILLILVVLFPVSEKNIYETSPDKIENNYSLYILDDTHPLQQTFRMRGDKLESLSFFITGCDESSSESICISIVDNIDVIYKASVPISNLDPNDYTDIEMDLNLIDGHDYCVKFSTTGKKNENSPRIIVVPDKDGTIKYGGKRLVGEKVAIKYQTSAVEYNYKNMSIVSCMATACLLYAYALFKRRRQKTLQISVEKAWTIVSSFSLFVFFVDIIVSRGNCLSHILFYDEADTGMDFFNSIISLKGNAPYRIYKTLYPPLADAFFSLIYHCVPENIIATWPLSYDGTVEIRQTAADLRVYQATAFIFILFIVTSTLLMCCMCKRMVCEQRSITISVISLFSFGFLSAFERGNIIILSFVCTYVFVVGRHSSNPIKRELAYISLALAAGLKIYPALYGLLLIKEKKWNDALRTMLYGGMSVVLPCFLFEEKLSALRIWFDVLMDGPGGLSTVPWIGYGMTNMVHRLGLYILQNFGVSMSDNVVQAVSICILLLMLVYSLILRNDKYSTFLITVVMCSLRPQSDYIFIFYLIPLFLMLKDSEVISKENLLQTVVMLLLTAPIPLFYVRDVMYPRVVLTHFLYLVIVIWMLYMIVKDFIKWKSTSSDLSLTLKS